MFAEYSMPLLRAHKLRSGSDWTHYMDASTCAHYVAPWLENLSEHEPYSRLVAPWLENLSEHEPYSRLAWHHADRNCCMQGTRLTISAFAEADGQVIT